MINRYNIICLFVFISFSCKTMRYYSNETIYFVSNTNNNRYKIKLPKGYTKTILKNEPYIEYRFMYKDSSIIFINDDCNSVSELNYNNIRSQNNTYYLGFLRDSIVLSGISDSLYNWKERKMGNICIGYINVPSEKKEFFDKSLESLSIK